MSVIGMHALGINQYEPEKARRALDMLLADRMHEFCELATTLLHGSRHPDMEYWDEFVLNFCLGVDCSFQSWSGTQYLPNSPQKSLIILRQLCRTQTSMNQLTHLLNISYTISTEFKEIYKRF